MDADEPRTPRVGQGAHEVQWALGGAAACPSGPLRPRRLHRSQVLPPESKAGVWPGHRGPLRAVHGQPPGTGWARPARRSGRSQAPGWRRGGWGVGVGGVAVLGPIPAESPATSAGCWRLHGRGSARPEGTLGVPPGGGGPRHPERGREHRGAVRRSQHRQVGGRAPRASPATWRGPLLTTRSALRTLQFGHMSITVEKQTVHETKADTVAPGTQGLLSLHPDNFVFYVGGYPSDFTVSLGPHSVPPGPAPCVAAVPRATPWAPPPGSALGEGRPDLCPVPTAPGASPLSRLPRLHRDEHAQRGGFQSL